LPELNLGEDFVSNKISIIGSGYVGLVTGMGFVKLGNEVTFIDIDEEKIQAINESKPPIYEEGLEELMQNFKGKYHATTDYKESILNTDATFISVGTPTGDDGSIDLRYVKTASAEIGKILNDKQGFHTVVVKSTVIPGTTEEIVKPILESNSNKTAGNEFGLAMNPEFLREGVALEDFLNPDRIVIGLSDDKTRGVLEKIYEPFNVTKLFTGIKTAEMIKYTANSFLATKISFSNEIGNLCKKLDIDSYDVFEGVGLDHRISPNFFRAGAGFGGSCFPKDVKALIKKAEEIGEPPEILKSTMNVNESQPLLLINLLKKHVPTIQDKTIGVLGLAFKPNSDDIRETRAVPVIDKLIKEGAQIIAYDPLAVNNFKELFPNLDYKNSANEVLDKTDIILILTEWSEFEEIDYSGKIVIDGRRVENAKKTAKIYEGICW
jgi:UDPglucose 6-dehydrogenase